MTRFIKLFRPFLSLLPKSRNSKAGNFFRQLDRFALGASLSEKERYWRWASYFDDDIILPLLQNKASKNELDQRKSQILRHFGPAPDFNAFLLTDMELVLANDMLTKTDLMSMENSLEVRVPLLDHHIVDFAFSLPPEYKINQGIQKRILQDAFQHELPAEIYNRPKKGFEVPLLKWFKTELRSKIENEYLHPDWLAEQGIFNPMITKNLLNKLYSADPGETHMAVWALIVFQHWYKKFYLA